MVKPYCTNIEKYTYNSHVEGPHIVLVGSAHGNEPAGDKALRMLRDALDKKLFRLKKGKITIIPCMNPCGKKLGIRFQPHQILIGHAIDLNRNFGTLIGKQGTCTVSRKIEHILSDADFVIDMHEGYDFNNRNPNSMGSGIFPGNSKLSQDIAYEIKDELNETIVTVPPIKRRWYENEYVLEDFKFKVLPDWDDIEGTLRYYCNTHGKDYILIETTGQANVQPLIVRALQHYQLAISACKKLNVLDIN